SESLITRTEKNLTGLGSLDRRTFGESHPVSAAGRCSLDARFMREPIGRAVEPREHEIAAVDLIAALRARAELLGREPRLVVDKAAHIGERVRALLVHDLAGLGVVVDRLALQDAVIVG